MQSDSSLVEHLKMDTHDEEIRRKKESVSEREGASKWGWEFVSVNVM